MAFAASSFVNNTSYSFSPCRVPIVWMLFWAWKISSKAPEKQTLLAVKAFLAAQLTDWELRLVGPMSEEFSRKYEILRMEAQR